MAELQNKVLEPLSAIGGVVENGLAYVGGLAQLLADAFAQAVTSPLKRSLNLQRACHQAMLVGVSAVPVISFITFFIGVIMALQAQQVRVPEDLKLVLHKNEAIDLLCPVPATFAVSSERAVARALIEQVQKQFRGEPVEPMSLPFRLLAHAGSSPRETNQPMKGVSQL